MGKKALLFQIALNITASTQKSVYVQSLNLLENQIVRRMISQMAGIGIKTGSEEVLSVGEKDCMYSCQLEVLRALKQLAKEKNMMIILCSQLPRRPECRGDKRPKLQDLREGVEKEVDDVIFIYRDAYYSRDVGDNAELILAKNPNWKTDTAYVRFNENTGMFENKKSI